MLTFVSVAVLAALAVFIWNMPDNGASVITPTGDFIFSEQWTNPWDDADVAGATAAGQAWLDTEPGTEVFGGGVAADAVPVFSEDKELVLWIVPIKDDEGLYQGFLQADGSDPELLDSYMKYAEPLEAFINRDIAIDVHTFFILKYGTDYAPEQITEPFVVIKKEGGFFWMSEIVKNNQAIEKVFSDIRLFSNKS